MSLMGARRAVILQRPVVAAVSTVPTDGRTLSLDFVNQLYHGCAVGGSLAERTLAQLVTGATGTAAPGASGCLIQAADDVSVVMSPAVFGAGSWWQASAGTFYVHSVIAYVNTTFPRIFEMTDGSDDNRLIARYNEAVSVAGVVTVSTTDAELTNTPYATTAKLCIAYDATGFSTVLNGAAAATNAAVVPTLTALQLGNRGTTKNRQLDGYVRELRFYPTKKTEAAMQALTT
jgi:hypothetical protein